MRVERSTRRSTVKVCQAKGHVRGNVKVRQARQRTFARCHGCKQCTGGARVVARRGIVALVLAPISPPCRRHCGHPMRLTTARSSSPSTSYQLTLKMRALRSPYTSMGNDFKSVSYSSCTYASTPTAPQSLSTERLHFFKTARRRGAAEAMMILRDCDCDGHVGLAMSSSIN